MDSSRFFNCVLLLALLLLDKRAAPNDSPPSGFNGAERDALLALKAEFKNSFLNDNWTGIMCYMNVPPYWFGIQCLNGRVTGVLLENMGLKGSIRKDSLANLTELSVLSLKNNSISGDLMDFSRNQKLKEIDISNNLFDGEIQNSLLSLNSLESLQLQVNKLTGQIPGFNQSTLKEFNVSYNNLSGEVPDTKVLQSFDSSSFFGNHDLCRGSPCTSFDDPIRDSVNGSSKDGTASRDKKTNDSHNSNGSKFIAILVVSDVVVLVVILFFCITYYRKYNRLKKVMKQKNLIPNSDEENDGSIVERARENRLNAGENRGSLVFMDNTTTTFELDDLLRASAEGLGKGNFGKCYKAMLEGGAVVVVKRLRDLKPLTNDEFVKQVRGMASLKHPNLLPPLGYYYSKEEKLLLYKFVSNGNLYMRIHGGRGTRDRIPYRWTQRLSVARAVGRALAHLHLNVRLEYAPPPHGNLKSSNVLLDENDQVLVCDFGLNSLIAHPIAAQRMVSFKSPEYQLHKKVSRKSDVWSYGSLLMELLTGKVPEHSAPEGTTGVDLCSWVHRAVREEWTAEIFDVEIAVQRGANHGMLKLMRIAMRCCDKLQEKRPEMGEVVRELEEIKAVVDSEDDEDLSASLDRSLERSLTDDSLTATPSITVGDH